MRHGEHLRILGSGVERALRLNGPQTGKSLFHQAASGPQERCQGRAVDSGMRPEEPHQGEFRTRAHSPGHAQAEPPHHGPQRGEDLQLQQA